MKLITIITFILFSNIIFCQDLSEYDLSPYNNDFKFRIIDENEIVEKNDSLEVLIIIFNKPINKNAEISISNNSQLKEIKLFYSNQDILNFIAESNLPQLTHLFCEKYNDTLLEIPAFPNIQHLRIQSTEVKKMNMTNSQLDKLLILDIQTPQLKNWHSAKYLPQLELIELDAQSLEYFPIENMPKIFQFSYYCSFKELPLNLCEYKDLMHISFSNYFPLKVEKCLQEKLKSSFHSTITIYDKIDGKVISEIFSKDRNE